MRKRVRTTPMARARALMALALWIALSAGSVIAWRSHAGARATHSATPAGVPREVLASGARGIQPSPPRGAADDELSRIIDRLREEQRESVERSLRLLETRFDGWRDRGNDFALDLLRWSTRSRLAWSAMRDAIDPSGDRQRLLVRDRFESSVVSESELAAAVGEAWHRLRVELRADRVRALARLRDHRHTDRALASPETRIVDLDAARLGERLDAALLQQSTRSLATAGVILVGGAIVTEVVAAAAGAAVVGAASGAAGGSVVPVAGTIVGFSVGLGAGIAADWWLSEQARQDLARRSGSMVDALRVRIIEGEPHNGWPGMRDAFTRAAEREAQWMESHLRSGEGGLP